MPVLISNGKPFRVSFMSLLTGSVREGRPSLRYDTRSVSPDFYQDIPRARAILRRGQANLGTHTTQWSIEDDRVLRDLKASKVSWKRISMVMDHRPIAELKKRWIDIQGDKHEACEVRKVYRLDDEDDDWYFDEKYDKERHVSFGSSTDEDEDEDTEEDDDSRSRRSKTKRIYYIDNEFTLDEVLLLHQIAADWKKDRWETISSRFNQKTGRDITPAQAKSVIND